MAEYELGLRLREMYDHAPKGEAKSHIHLFGIQFADEIKGKKYSVKEVVKAAGLPPSYHTEVHTGMRLAKYVEIKKA